MKKTTASLLAFAVFLCAAHAERVILDEELAPVVQSVGAVEESVGALDARTDEYVCTWVASNLVSGVANWIQTNWPARKIWCFVNINAQGDYSIAMPDWTPAEPRELHLAIRKQSGTNTTMAVYAPDGSGIASSATSSITYRTCEFYFYPGVGWLTGAVTWTSETAVSSALPADIRFLPTTNAPVARSVKLAEPVFSDSKEDLFKTDDDDVKEEIEPEVELKK